MDFESKDQLDNSISQSLETQPEENKQRMEELREELRLRTDDANPTNVGMQALKARSNGQLEKRKRVRIFWFSFKYSTFCGRKVKAIQDPGKIGTYGL